MRQEPDDGTFVRQERQRFIRHYKDVTGEQKIDMHKVAAYAKRHRLVSARCNFGSPS
jgi:hypothetical protein